MSLRFRNQNRSQSMDDYNDQETESFPSYRTRRQFLLKLVRKQIDNARLLLNDDVSQNMLPKRDQTKKASFNFVEHPTKNQSSCSMDEFHPVIERHPADPHHQGRKVHSLESNREADEEESLDLEWTANFDSQNSLSEYRVNYLKAVGSLLGDFEIHPRSEVCIPKDDVSNCTSEFSSSNLKIPSSSSARAQQAHKKRMNWTMSSQNPPCQKNSTQIVYKTGAPSGGDGKAAAASAAAAKAKNDVPSKIISYLSLPPSICCANICNSSLNMYLTATVFGVILLFGIVGYALSKHGNTFNFVAEIEWPWSMFMKEPLFKGFMYSANRNFYANNYDWS